ncbi:MAG: succinylglutamate desuccinylase/aspartoacylase family protein [Leptolyngbyaceae cyanobacterium SM1_1_3]|nr:succinylglutamate desuccinylase/aspartoacylase family protein [Leptolyngbyaceae cyanobacterium SM1_1_3]NJN03305.1 succinylglutamate desuccinylase/aspartoacylase family protein [Leptolyngbyaceae cyanobacterium RM1_1_2]NJO09514.1 succinylglutamate desuccinylase/aspartoacylase family protein [Leptolyngbyaceae cyanobacterium SL_1_1]
MHPKIVSLPLMQLASGDRLELQTYRFIGDRPGKKAYIQANLHGAELAGNAVIHELIQWLAQLDDSALYGEICLVPVCNPMGVNQRAHNFASGRYNPYDGRDYNRIFWDYEKTGADTLAFAQSHLNRSAEAIVVAYRQQIQAAFATELGAIASAVGVPVHELYRTRLQALALDADYVIDLHSSTNEGLDYVYYFRDRDQSACHFGLDFGILLDKYDGDAFDEAFVKPWLALEAAFKQLGRSLRCDIEAWTLELGTGMQLNPQSVERGLKGVKNYLVRRGLLPEVEVSDVSEVCMALAHRSQVTKYYATTGGVVENRVRPGTEVKAGDLLYQLLCFNKSATLPSVSNIQAQSAGLVYDISTNRALSQGEYVLSIVRLD